MKNAGKYDIIKLQNGRATSVNDQLRQIYPGNILVELSPMNGNPLGPFGDINNIKNTFKSNIYSFISTMSNLNRIMLITNELIGSKSINIEQIYSEIDKLFEQNKRMR